VCLLFDSKLIGKDLIDGYVIMIVLGSLQAATDILDKRGNIYSSRPRNIMGLVRDNFGCLVIIHS
jgi:hypothetical protein